MPDTPLKSPLSSISTHQAIEAARRHLNSEVIGQGHLIERMLMTLLCGGHFLVEGAPGLAKTRAIKALSDIVEGDFHRIQFTPDLLPSDVTGTEIYRPEDGSFNFQRDPIFNNLILADEINRAPAKVQSALLEAMAENQVSFGRQTFALPTLFMVMATQNSPSSRRAPMPYPARLNWIGFYCTYLSTIQTVKPRPTFYGLCEMKTLGQKRRATSPPLLMTQTQIHQARQELLALHMAEPVERYIVELILATPRTPPSELAPLIELGASLGELLDWTCARTHAWLMQRDFL